MKTVAIVEGFMSINLYEVPSELYERIKAFVKGNNFQLLYDWICKENDPNFATARKLYDELRACKIISITNIINEY